MFFPEQSASARRIYRTPSTMPRSSTGARPRLWTGCKPLFDPHSAAVVIPRWRVQDIDTEDDWRRAELIYELSKQRTHSDK